MDAPMSTEALGRSLTLGTLYDCRNDKLVPGLTLWDNDALSNNVTSHPKQDSKMRVVASDSISDKANALGVSADLKVSIMVGLVPVDGAGSYFHDSQESSEVVRVVLKYESISRFDKLTMKHLANGNYMYPEVFDKGDATHVVVQVEYGADAFFVFEKSSSMSSSSKKVHGELQLRIKAIRAQFEGSPEVDLQSHENKDTEDIACNFHGDFQLGTIPTTYKEALQVIQQLPQLLKDNPPVPKRVHLYPLCKLDTRAAKLERSISESLIAKVEYILQQTIDIQVQVSGLSNSPASAVPFLQQELSDYKRVLNLASSVFKKQLVSLLPLIRGGNEEEKTLGRVLCDWERSIMAPHNFKSVLDGIKCTMNWIKSQLSAAKRHGLQEAFGPDLEELTSDVDNDLAVCFTLNRDVLISKGLMAISAHLHDNTYTSAKLPKEWHNNEKSKKIMKERFRLFQDYAKLNKDKQKIIEYIVTDGEVLNNSDPAIIQISIEGEQELINLATAPGKPYLTGQTTTDQAYIEWEHPTEGKDTVNRYILWYSPIENDSWESVEVHANPRYLMTNLKPGMKYVFKVQADTKAGVSPMSLVSEPVLMEAETRLAMRILEQCDCCTGTNDELDIYTPKHRYDNSHGLRVKKYEIGIKRVNSMKAKTIIVLGATGTGKTTYLNSMINYLTEVRLTDDFRFKLITQQDEGIENAYGMTKNVTAYVLHETILPYTLTVVDTPGYLDCEGLKADKETTNLIKQLFEAKSDVGGIDQLDAICLVVKSTDSRLTQHQVYNFNSVLALFDTDMADIIIIIVTFCDASKPPVILALQEAEVPYKDIYKFNNSAFFESKKNDRLGNAAQQFYWELGQASFEEFFRGLETMHPRSLTLSLEVLKNREQLEHLVLHLQQQVNSGMSDLETMRQEAMAMELYEAKIKANENFKYEVIEEKFVREEISGKSKQHTTTCMNCNYTCHDNCFVATDERKWWCCAMDWSGNCKVCPKKCKHDMHKNVPYIYKSVTETVTKTDEELRKKYAKCKDDFQQKDNLMGNLGEKFGAKEMDILGTIKLINQSLNKLKKIAMRPDHLTNVEYIEGLIESEKRQKKFGWTERIQYLNDQKDLAVKCEQSKDPNFDPFWKQKQEKGSWIRYVKKKLGKWWNWNLPPQEAGAGALVPFSHAIVYL